MLNLIKFLTLILIFNSNLSAIDNSKNERLLFQPLLANPFESRVGSFYQIDDNKLRLDIGASVDLYRDEINQNSEYSLGSDFMVYTRLRHDGRLKFPVETSDYFFGINGAYATTLNSMPLKLRLRIAHISSHIVDGMADSITLTKEPYVYSREFFDLVSSLNFSNLKLYTGATVIFSTLPKDVIRFNPQIGFEYKYDLGSNFEFISAYDFKLVGYNSEFFGQNALQVGILKKTYKNNGLFTGLYYYSGKSIHGMFYKDYDEYIGVGFQLFLY